MISQWWQPEAWALRVLFAGSWLLLLAGLAILLLGTSVLVRRISRRPDGVGRAPAPARGASAGAREVRPISRRTALQLAVLGAASAVLGGLGVRWGTGRAPAGAPGAGAGSARELLEPAVLRSAGGVLALELVAAAGEVKLAGRSATALAYNGTVPGPTLRMRPGDRLRVGLVNRLTRTTNLHTHGLVVSPEGNGDNPFVAVEPGERFDYDIHLPPDHPPGLFWYHPHRHGTVADQVFGGLFGAIVVEDDTDLPVTRERVMVISDVTLGASGAVAIASRADRQIGREGEVVLVNGQLRPVLRARPGERERWRLVNACVSRFLDLRLPGQNLALLGVDSGRYATPLSVDRVVLAPGNRADLLVQAVAGSTGLLAVPVDRGAVMGMMGMGTMGRPRTSVQTVSLATLQVEGDPVEELPAVPTQAPARDLADLAVARGRRITLAMGMGMGMSGGRGPGMSFTIDGREFDPARTDLDVREGEVEEWTLVNTSPMDHPFHLHVWPMQVLREGSAVPKEPTWRDVVNVPAEGSSVVRIAFEQLSGRTVYHCHVLDHEDLGMMGVIDVG